ncbi:bifunctional adenosylcobinamide kinase/adenosylcobinamide-phosphate guanylyltransferase [Chloroflexi bacterium TSY]|nr:bifunctional adenosylcobinamide kinase/adenosylcobinamide-phosphate guanylyltransferase [Chloroflexi bacterium TSY]
MTLYLILGGARSGKSRYAEMLAQELGGNDVLYIATAQAFDDEMRERIAKHQRERPVGWRTMEAPTDVGKAIQHAANATKVVLLDCLTVLVSNVLLKHEDPFTDEATAAVESEIDGLVTNFERLEADVIIVSNEVGMGLVPPYPLGRAYRDLLGKANQRIAGQADIVKLMIAGIPMDVK